MHVALFKYIERLENSECLIAQISAMVGEELNPNGNIYKSFSDEETLQLVRAAATVRHCGSKGEGGREGGREGGSDTEPDSELASVSLRFW